MTRVIVKTTELYRFFLGGVSFSGIRVTDI